MVENNRNVVAVVVVVVVVVVEGKQYRVSQKFVPLILCAITFDWIKTLFVEDVYSSIEYMYSEFQELVCPLCFYDIL